MGEAGKLLEYFTQDYNSFSMNWLKGLWPAFILVSACSSSNRGIPVASPEEWNFSGATEGMWFRYRGETRGSKPGSYSLEMKLLRKVGSGWLAENWMSTTGPNPKTILGALYLVNSNGVVLRAWKAGPNDAVWTESSFYIASKPDFRPSDTIISEVRTVEGGSFSCTRIEDHRSNEDHVFWYSNDLISFGSWSRWGGLVASHWFVKRSSFQLDIELVARGSDAKPTLPLPAIKAQ
jgi:hypothetical protein